MRKITYLASLILIFSIPWEDSITVASLGSIARIVGIAVAGLWVATVLLEGKFRKPSAFHVLVLLFFLWNLASIFWSLNPQSTIQRIETYAQIFFLMLICWDVYQTPDQLRAGLQAYVLGAYVLVISTIFNYLSGNVSVQYEGRYSATGVNAVDVALILILGLPLAIPIAMEHFFVAGKGVRGAISRAIDLFYIPLSVFTIILTGSRTSLIAILPFAIFMIGTQRISFERKLLISVAVILCAAVALPLIPQSVIARLSTIGMSIGQGDLGGRVNLWMEGIAELAQHPILGIGGGAIDTTIGAAVHNTFLSIAVETGFIGFVLFLAILGTVINALAKMSRLESPLWLAILFTWAIGVLSLSWEFRKVTWIVLSFIVIAGSVEQKAAETEEGISLTQDRRQAIEKGEFVSLPRTTG